MQLFDSVASGDLQRMKRLIREGADVCARDYNDSTPLHVAAAKNFICGATHLIESGADINRKDVFGLTPLDIAMQRRNKPMVDVLTSAGARSQSLRRCVSSVSDRRCAKDVLV